MAAYERSPAPKPGIYPGVPMEEYLSWDAWSRSDIARMREGPEACKWHRDQPPGESTKAQEFGTLAHTCLFEPELWPPEDVVFLEGPFNKNPGKKDKREAEELGKRVVATDVRDNVEALVERLWDHPLVAQLLELSEGEREVSAVAKCPVTGLLLKARCDLRAPSINMIADLKTTSKASDPHFFANQLWDYDYYLAAPHYCEVFGWASGTVYDKFLFIVVPQKPPFLPRIYALDPQTLEAGQDMNHQLRRRVAECVASGVWPAKTESIEPLGLSNWRLGVLAGELEAEAKE